VNANEALVERCANKAVKAYHDHGADPWPYIARAVLAEAYPNPTKPSPRK
jgi:hypothetical protein